MKNEFPEPLAHELPEPLVIGGNLIRSYAETLPPRPGVYRMLGARGEALYVGKATNLKNRVRSYTHLHRLSTRLKRMVSETRSMEFVTTHTEIEALLLEANLIKKLSPRYNVLLKDDKFFSYIALTDHPFPRLMKFRGAKNQKDRYFGPFASGEAVTNSLGMLHRIFRLRSCTDGFFASRDRPCLQYHIKRCTAPCVGFITPQAYQDSVQRTVEFLEGKSQALQRDLAARMSEASKNRAFEQAATYRDQIRALTHLQAQQNIHLPGLEDTDVFGLAQQENSLCVQVFFFRGGSNFGTASLFPQHTEDLTPSQLLASVLGLFYDDKSPPPQILLSHPLDRLDQALLQKALSSKASYKVKLHTPVRGRKVALIQQATRNAEEALERRLHERHAYKTQLVHLARALDLTSPLQRIEVYDNSHIQGTDQVGAMIVAGPHGFEKKAYRKFTFRHIPVPGDDYAMMRELLRRRFAGSQALGPHAQPLPDLVIIDGGKGQLSAALQVLEEVNQKTIPVLAISKGPHRHAGQETFHTKTKGSFSLEKDKSLLYFLQRLRDEAHRFAIGTHRARRTKNLRRSILDDIPGIGPQRKRDLLKHFGSAQGVRTAGIKDLQAVEGISETLAKNLYTYFHGT